MSRFNNGEEWWREFKKNYPEASEALEKRFGDTEWFSKIIGLA